MKIHKPSLNSYIGHVLFLQEALERKLTQKELKIVMDRYIHSVKIEKTLEGLKG